jgi:hypothetical protein
VNPRRRTACRGRTTGSSSHGSRTN